MKHQHTGKVILAGAGPGDPELVTLKTVRYLQQADVVLTDRLVVRLKGGDVSIFSNILDELQVLVKHGISYEIIPGITASLGAAAYAGIPLTARDYSTAIRILTYYKPNALTDEYWKGLAQTDDTLVFYMSSENLDRQVTNLIKNNIAADKLLAVVEQATTPLQHVTFASLYEYDRQLKGKSFVSPSLVIIGKVVALHEQFAWLSNSYCSEFYFNPVAAKSKRIINADKEIEHVS